MAPSGGHARRQTEENVSLLHHLHRKRKEKKKKILYIGCPNYVFVKNLAKVIEVYYFLCCLKVSLEYQAVWHI